jgi:acetylornithine deacetylase/succinyl-diaminopimelate desuccinylase-like protein
MVASPMADVVTVLQDLVRINTVNPPGNERPAQEYLAALLADAGLEVSLVGPELERPNLVARLRGRAEGPVLGLLSHVDTVLADPAGWRHDPWSGALDEGCVWGRGALDMKSQTAAEAVAVCSLAVPAHDHRAARRSRPWARRAHRRPRPRAGPRLLSLGGDRAARLTRG